MSLSLSGQLGSAGLGAAQLGQLASAALQGAFMLPPAGGGAVVEEPKKKKQRKKRKRATLIPTSVPRREAGRRSEPTAAPSIPAVIISQKASEAIAESINAIERERRRQHQILEEEDELLELGVL